MIAALIRVTVNGLHSGDLCSVSIQSYGTVPMVSIYGRRSMTRYNLITDALHEYMYGSRQDTPRWRADAAVVLGYELRWNTGS